MCSITQLIVTLQPCNQLIIWGYLDKTEENMKKKIAIVARVSTVDKQDYNRQIDDLKEVINKHGHNEEDIEIFADEISGYSKNEERPEFSKLLNRIDEFQRIYVTEISRLGRNPSQVRTTIDAINDKKIPIYIKSLNRFTVDESGERDFIMSIIIQVMIEMADAESRQMKERSKSGLLRGASIGRAGGGATLAYGYTKDDDKMLVIEPNEAEIVMEIFNLYKGGEGIKSISNILNERKIPTKTQNTHDAEKIIKFSERPKAVKDMKWTDKAVYGILKNTLYKGERNFKGKVFTNVPPIVSADLFDQVQDIRETKTHRNYLTTYTYLLKDLIKCGCCGNNYFAKFKPVTNGDKVYICASRIKNKFLRQKCTNAGVNISLVESAIYDQLVKSDKILPYLSQVKEMTEEMKFKLLRAENDLQAVNSTVEQKQKENKKLIDLYMTEIIPLEELDERRKSIDKAISTLINKQTSLKRVILDLKISLEKHSEAKINQSLVIDAANNRTELRSIFQQFIERVIVNDIDNGLIFVSVFIKVEGVVLRKPLKLVLDKQAIQTKKKDKPYRYVQFRSLVNEPIYVDSKLIVDSQDILEEIKSEMNFQPWTACEKVLTVL